VWLRLRNTARRGRSPVPVRLRRIRSWRFCRAAPRLATWVMLLVPLRLPDPRLLLAADLAGLAGLAADDLARIADALALVRLGLAGGPDARGDLADELLVDPDHGHPRRILELEADPLGRLDLDRMAVAQVELQLVAHLLGAVAHAGDLEALAIAGRDAGDHVGDQRPGEAVKLLVHLRLGRAADHDGAVLRGHDHVGMELPAERATGTVDGDRASLDGDLHPVRDRDGQATDTRHIRPTRRTPGLRRRARLGG